MVCKNGVKMSKSKGNVVPPDSIIRPMGADTMRLYILFCGPPERDIEWNDESVEGCYRFLNRVWRTPHGHLCVSHAGFARDETFDLVVEVNGKIRARSRPRGHGPRTESDRARTSAHSGSLSGTAAQTGGRDPEPRQHRGDLKSRSHATRLPAVRRSRGG
jgi:hypothetical protein